MAAPTGTGELKFRIRFDKPINDLDAEGGGTVQKWSTEINGSFTRWAAIRPLQGREEVMAQRLQGQQPALLFVIYDENTRDIDSSWRAVELLHDNRVKNYAIKTAEDMERERRFITILVVAGAPDA